MIEIIEDPAGFEKLREEWQALLENSASDCFFLTWEWLHTWWKHLSAGRRLHLVTVRDGQALVALAPLALSPRRLSRLLPFRSLEFLGTEHIGSDYLDLIIKRGKEQEALPALAEYLARGKQVLTLAHFKRSSSFATELAAQLRLWGWTFSEAKRAICPYIDFVGLSWQSYLATLGPQHRYNFRRRCKNLAKQFEVRFEQVHSEEQRRQALALLVALHNLRWRERGRSDAFHTQTLLSFHEELSRLALERGWLRLFVLWLDGKPAAALYGFRYRRSFYFLQSGFDPSYAKHSVGLVTLGLAIKSAIEDGAAEFDLLRGEEEYKSSWAREAHELGRLVLYPPRLRGLLYRRAAGLNQAARSMARRVLPRTIIGPIAASGLSISD